MEITKQVGRLLAGVVVGGWMLLAGPAAWALGPDQIALVVNNNDPESRKLAEFYATARGIPEGRIIGVSVPVGDDLRYDYYEAQVVQPVREYLREKGLQEKVTCLVTFYGMPLRVNHWPVSPQDKQEVAGLQEELKKLPAAVAEAVRPAEHL